jgi:hypothetical protein
LVARRTARSTAWVTSSGATGRSLDFPGGALQGPNWETLGPLTGQAQAGRWAGSSAGRSTGSRLGDTSHSGGSWVLHWELSHLPAETRAGAGRTAGGTAGTRLGATETLGPRLGPELGPELGSHSSHRLEMGWWQHWGGCSTGWHSGVLREEHLGKLGPEWVGHWVRH